MQRVSLHQPSAANHESTDTRDNVQFKEFSKTNFTGRKRDKPSGIAPLLIYIGEYKLHGAVLLKLQNDFTKDGINMADGNIKVSLKLNWELRISTGKKLKKLVETERK